jgi:hypothetical protein
MAADRVAAAPASPAAGRRQLGLQR